MLTFLAVAEARQQDVRREVAELRRLAAARAVDYAPPGESASARRTRTAFWLKTLSSSKEDGPCLSTPHPG